MGTMTDSAISKKMGHGHQVGPGHVVPPEEGVSQGGGGEWGSERSPRSHFKNRRNKGPRREGAGTEKRGPHPASMCPVPS